MWIVDILCRNDIYTKQNHIYGVYGLMVYLSKVLVNKKYSGVAFLS